MFARVACACVRKERKERWSRCFGMQPGVGPAVVDEHAAAGGHGTPQTGKRQRVETGARRLREAHDHLVKARHDTVAAKEAAEAAFEALRAPRAWDSNPDSADIANYTAAMSTKAIEHIDAVFDFAQYVAAADDAPAAGGN